MVAVGVELNRSGCIEVREKFHVWTTTDDQGIPQGIPADEFELTNAIATKVTEFFGGDKTHVPKRS